MLNTVAHLKKHNIKNNIYWAECYDAEVGRKMCFQLRHITTKYL